MPYKILALVAAGAVLLTLVPMEPRFDVALRIIVSGVAAWGVVVALGEGRTLWTAALAALAVVFNPFYVAPLDGAAWAVLGIAAAAVLVAASTRVGTLLGPTGDHPTGDQS